MFFYIMLFINLLILLVMEFSQVQVLKSSYKYEKGKYRFSCCESWEYSREEYERFTSKETVNWFKRLGSEQVLVYQQTSFGRKVTQLSSYAPDKTEKQVYNFRFIH